MTAGLLLEHPAPDFAELAQVLRGKQEPRRVHLVELLIDEEVLRHIAERYLGGEWVPLTAESQEPYFKQLATLYYRLGYDYVPVAQWPVNWINHPAPRRRRTKDTAELSRGEREWVDESSSLISSWDELEQFPWDVIEPDLSPFELAVRHLPPGMKIVVSTNLLEHVLENLLGYEGLFFRIHDDPELVGQVFAQWGQKVHSFYESLIGMEQVGAIFHADDMGFKTSTLISPDSLRQYVFPWLKRYAALAHMHGKMFWLHSCGNHYRAGTVEDLIQDVEIDAFHSFEDAILPAVDFKARFGDQVATLGGVDMDKMVRMEEADLREYIQSILERCMPGGRFALGTGNSVANYIPLRNYSLMLEQSRRFSC